MIAINNIKKNLSYYVLIAIVVLFGIIMATLYSVPVFSKGLVFSLYTLFGMLLPGYALVNLLKIKCRTDIELITYMIFFGYFASFLEYFFVVPLGAQNYAPFVWIAFFLISAFYLVWKNKKKELITFEKQDNFGIWVCIGFLLLIIIIRCGLYAGENLLPYGEGVEKTSIYEDILYWIGNSIALTKRFPPLNFRNIDNTFNYHYFTSLQIAIASLSTKINVMLLSLCFSYIYPTLMLVFAGYSVFSKCNKNNTLRILGMISFFFTSGFSDFTDSRYAGYMYEYPFAFDYGMAVFMFLVFLVMDEFYKEKLRIKNIMIIVVFFGLLCGVKASFAAIALVGIGIVCCRWLFNIKQRRKALVIGGCALTVFVVLYILVTNVSGYRPQGGAITFSSNLLTNAGGYGSGKMSALYEKLLTFNFPKIVNGFLITVIFFLISNPLVFGICFIQMLRALIKKQKLADGSFALFSMIMAGVILRLFVGMYGWSEQYFLYNVFPIGTMFMLLNWEMDVIEQTFRCRAKIFGICGLLILSIWGFVKYDGGYAFITDTLNGYSRYAGSNYLVDDYIVKFNKEQFEAYEWLRENSDSEDRFVANSWWYRWDMGCVSERYHVWPEDYNMIWAASSEEEANTAAEKLKEQGVSWAVNIKEDGDASNRFAPASEHYEKVYENSEIDIFKIY